MTILPALYPDLTIAKTHNGDFTQGLTGQYSITVSNAGAASTSGPIYVADAMPNGLTAVKVSGSGWICSISGSAVDCSRADSLAISSQYPAIVIGVKVAPNAPAAVQNIATVRGGGESNESNDTAIDATRIVVPPLPRFTITEAADRSTVEVGDVVTYTLQMSDVSAISSRELRGK